MREMIMKDTNETKTSDMPFFQDIKPQTGMKLNEAKSFMDNLFSQPDLFYRGYDERLSNTPAENSELGEWEGERGESKFLPSETTERGAAAKEKLDQYELDGIEYRNAEPDFSKCSEATVQIDNMTENRADYIDDNGKYQKGNFSQADLRCAEQWNAEEKDGRNDWTDEKVKQYRQNNKLSWHERCDTQTMDLVSQDIHGFFIHSGGVAECKARDNNIIGGDFDE